MLIWVIFLLLMLGTLAMLLRHLSHRWLIIVSILVFVATFALYVGLGSPNVKSQPFAARQNDPYFVMARIAEDMSTRLKEKPDGNGYAVLSETLFRINHFREAIEAGQKAIGMGVVNAEILASIGEAYVMANDGVVVDEAQKAFSQALQLEPKAPRPRFYSGLARAQKEDFKEAVAIWRDLERDSPPDAPWMAMLNKYMIFYANKGG